MPSNVRRFSRFFGPGGTLTPRTGLELLGLPENINYRHSFACGHTLLLQVHDTVFSNRTEDIVPTVEIDSTTTECFSCMISHSGQRPNPASDAAGAEPIVGDAQATSASTTPRASHTRLVSLVDGAPSWRLINELEEQLRRLRPSGEYLPPSESITENEPRFQPPQLESEVPSVQGTSLLPRASSSKEAATSQEPVNSRDPSNTKVESAIDISKAPKGPRNWSYNRRKGPSAKQTIGPDNENDEASSSTTHPRRRRRADRQLLDSAEVYDEEEWRAKFPDQEEPDPNTHSKRVTKRQGGRSQEESTPKTFSYLADEASTARSPRPVPEPRPIRTIPTPAPNRLAELIDSAATLQILNDMELELREIGRQRWRREAMAAGQLPPVLTYQGMRAEVFRGFDQPGLSHQAEPRSHHTRAANLLSPAGSNVTVRPAQMTMITAPGSLAPPTKNTVSVTTTQPQTANTTLNTYNYPAAMRFTPGRGRLVPDRWGGPGTWLYDT